MMCSQEIKNYIKDFERRTDNIVSSKKDAQNFLQKAGINTPTGNLKKEYKASK